MAEKLEAPSKTRRRAGWIAIIAATVSAGATVSSAFVYLNSSRTSTLQPTPTASPTPTSTIPAPPPTPPIDIREFLPEFYVLAAVVLGAAISLAIYFVMQQRARHEELMEIQKLEEEHAELDFKRIWILTQRRLEYYHNLATAQSRQSFISTQISTGAGFILIIVIGAIASQTTSIVATISVGAVGVVGGGLSAYIGRTFMRAQYDASAQLRQFFIQPVEFSRLLGAERLIETLPSSERAAAVQQVIKSMLPSPSSSQPMTVEHDAPTRRKRFSNSER